ncbi:PucC family protein [Phreatobacter sp.]|uniref:PucC family protein n=1 Tax=Phreatobacter sp. TaxID=1966341 RepID=UPI0025FBEC9C|nr:PucC family protein [Phreatobacter sp.]
MNSISQRAMRAWVGLGPRFLPFADAASAGVPLSRLLRLSLVQVSVGMSLVLMVGTLNRVMIVELGISAALVATMIALPVLFAPFRVLIGQSSDTHVSVLGWKRVPFLFNGTMVQFGGLALMPFALLVLSGGGAAKDYPVWIGQAAAALSFLLVGAGVHTTQTVALALATDLTRDDRRPKVVGLMYVMLLVGTIASALTFGYLLEEFTPGRLIQVIQGTAVVTIVLNGIALWKQEGLKRMTAAELAAPQPRFRHSFGRYMQGKAARRRLVAVGLGTMAFGMQDVLLEPYGGEILGLSVADTTKLTAALAGGGLIGFAAASHVLSRGADAFAIAGLGTLVGILGFAGVIAAAPAGSPMLFAAGVIVIGAGGGLFGHGTLTAAMNHAPEGQAGLALGAWGAIQATAAGLGIALGGILRDVAMSMGALEGLGAARGYMIVYATEIVLLLATFAAMSSLFRRAGNQSSRG